MLKGQKLNGLTMARRAWAKEVYGPKWRRALKHKQGNGSLNHGVSAFEAGWRACAGAIYEQAARLWGKSDA